MDSRLDKLPLLDLLKNTVIPRAEQEGMARIFTAYPAWRADMELPEGMIVTRKSLRGKRVPASAGRPYGTASLTSAKWPKDNLQEARASKLCLVVAGSATLQVADYLVHCLPGQGILIPAGTPFGVRATVDHSMQNQGIYETLQMMPYYGGFICWSSRHWQDADGEPHATEQTGSVPHSQVTYYFQQLVDEATKKQPHQRLLVDSLLRIVLALLHRELQQQPVLQTGETAALINLHPDKHASYSIKQAQEYIELNLRKSLSIDEVAHYVCMSRTVFTAQFRARTNKTFTRYVQDLRFEEASKFLENTDLGVHHIAAAVGLKPNRMRELFHEREQVTPQTFRQKSRISEK